MKRWSISEAATDFSVPRETLRRKLRQAGVAKASSYTTLEVFHALSPAGDLREQRLRAAIRNDEAQASLRELEHREKERDLISTAVVVEMIREALQPVRECFLAAPALLAQRCNPTDPQHAYAVLNDWVDNSLRFCREHNESRDAELAKAEADDDLASAAKRVNGCSP